MYPRLIRRIQALLIDSGVLLVVFSCSVAMAGFLKLGNEFYGAAVALLPVILVEPLLVSLTGGTVGHHMRGLRVRRVSYDKHLNIFLALFRTVVKALLGGLSLVFVLTTKKHQAIHDLVADSVIVINDPHGLPAREVLTERVLDHDHYYYPGVLRRLSCIFLYLLLFFIAISLMTFLSLSDGCIEYDRCGKVDSITYMLISLINWVGIFAIPALGWTCKLYGCRKVRKQL